MWILRSMDHLSYFSKKIASQLYNKQMSKTFVDVKQMFVK